MAIFCLCPTLPGQLQAAVQEGLHLPEGRTNGRTDGRKGAILIARRLFMAMGMESTLSQRISDPLLRYVKQIWKQLMHSYIC